MEKMTNSEFSLCLHKFYMFCVHVMYSTCSKLLFSIKHAKCNRVRIWEKPASTHTTARHTFHYQTIAVHELTIQASIDAESCLGCFGVACFWGLSDIHVCSGRLQMAACPLGKQTAGCNSPYDCLMSLAMDLAALCDMWRWELYQWMPFGWF